MKQSIPGYVTPAPVIRRARQASHTINFLPSSKMVGMLLLMLLIVLVAAHSTFDPPPEMNAIPGPAIVAFTIMPLDGHINLGQYATLNWEISNCPAPCQVTLEARDGANYTDLVSSIRGLPSKGTMKVMPTRSTSTKYTISALDSLGSDAASKLVELYCSIPCSTKFSGNVFYFKIQNSQIDSTSCFTVALYAQDAAAAQQMAEGFDGGYAAQLITEAGFLKEC